MLNRLSLALLLSLSVGVAGNVCAQSTNDAAQLAKGKRLFLKCQPCHDITESKLERIGPNLKGIVGKQAASVEGFKNYSKTLKALTVPWDETTLFYWLEDPEPNTPGTYMAFIGMPDPEDRKALIAYMKSMK